ncbi:MAG: hypothetical protein ACHQHN_05220 [Sphingobacteriales bacterium]
MEPIIYSLGLVAVGYIAYKLYINYDKSKINGFNKKALLTIILFDVEPIRNILKGNNNKPNINYLLSNIISITDYSNSQVIKNEYYGYCTEYQKKAEVEIKKILRTVEGQMLVKNKIEKYKSYWENELKEKSLIDLKLKQNRLKYLDDLTEIFKNNGHLSEFDLVHLLMDKWNINEKNIKDIVHDLSDKSSGLVFCFDGLFQLKANASGGTISELDKEILKISHELSIIDEINVENIYS